ncbi:MAG TPA: cell division protein FtsZ, partial [Burkholderiales bacterium]|nr:cell division protein FtsZ [Burkholderiales bacterium]
ATIIYGGVYDDPLEDQLRVTVVATGLGAPAAARSPKPQLVLSNVAGQKTGTDNLPGPVDYSQLDAVPAVIRRNRASTVEPFQQSGVDKYDIPAFLRKQAD